MRYQGEGRAGARRRFGRRRSAGLLVVVLMLTPLVLPMVAASAAPLTLVPTSGNDYDQVRLGSGRYQLGAEPMSLAVLPDRSVLHTARDGALRRTLPDGDTRVIGRLPIYSHDEDGLQGVAVDPDFAANRAIYLYYAPPLTTPGGNAPKTGSEADFRQWVGVNRLSRFTLDAGFGLNRASEKVLLEVPADRGMCCHVGGDIEFDGGRNLYLSTGDDADPHREDIYSPIDEGANLPPSYDARRSSANTNDLRGKVLRIRVEPDGTTSIPAGNLFPPGTPKTRPEIYAMGLRNPFRMSVDKKTNVLYLGDFGPDAPQTDPARGPAGQVEFNRIDGPGNYGWPFCTGGNTQPETYNRFDSVTGYRGPKYDCDAPVNDSPRNTGLRDLPKAKSAWIKYGGDGGTPPEFDRGVPLPRSESPMGGPVYRFDERNGSSDIAFPRSLDGVYFAGEFGRKWIKTVEVNGDGSPGAIADFPWQGKQIMDMAFGPDGALYVIDYGSGGGNDDAGLYRVEYSPGGKKPVAKAEVDRTSGAGPLTVAFSSQGSYDAEGPLSYRWDFGDGGTSTEANPAHTYRANGQYTAKLTVTDTTPKEPKTANARVTITVGNTAPTVNLTLPRNGYLFSAGDTVPFRISVSDPEEESIDCARVSLNYKIGHDRHSHLHTTANGCTGQINIPYAEHDGGNVYGVFEAEYTDLGANGQPALSTQAVHTLQPRVRQAEFYTGHSNYVRTQVSKAAKGEQTVAFIEDRSWISFAPFNLANATSFTARVSSAGVGGRIEVRAGSPTGTLLGTATVPVTGSWDTYTDVSTALAGAPAASTTLYLVFSGRPGFLFNVDEYRITTLGADAPVEGEAFSTPSGGLLAVHPGASGGHTVGHIHHGDSVGYASVPTAGARALSARVSSGGIGGTIEVRQGSATGPLLGSVPVRPTGGWGNFVVVSTLLQPSGSGPLFLRFTGGNGLLFDLDSFALTTDNGGTGRIAGKDRSCVGVSGGLAERGTPVVWWQCNEEPDQQWTVRPDGTVRSLRKCLDVAAHRTDNTAPVHLWDCATPPTPNQQWVAQLDGTLKNPVSGRCLDADAVRLQVQLWDCTGTPNQLWQLPTAGPGGDRVLVFHKTAGHRHDSIPAGVQAVRELGEQNGFQVDATADASAFEPTNLARYRAVMFLSTTGDVLDEPQQRAFEAYVRGGGGFVGVHAAADTEHGWPFYGTLVGAYFKSHPPTVQAATAKVEDRSHPATATLGDTWVRTDEWYDFTPNPRSRVHVLLSLDESSYSGGAMGADHPIAWCQRVDSGRSFYTAVGHAAAAFADPAVRAHLLGGIRTAAGMAPARCAPPARQ